MDLGKSDTSPDTESSIDHGGSAVGIALCGTLREQLSLKLYEVLEVARSILGHTEIKLSQLITRVRLFFGTGSQPFRDLHPWL